MGICQEDTTDSDIRVAFHAKYLRRAKSRPGTLVVDELGLAHAKSRVDVAVIGDCVHGYEIKSDRDTLDRLPLQLETYRRSLQKVTIVAAQKHISRVLASVPEWCGVIAVSTGPRGGMCFAVLRNARKNPEAEGVMLAHLLWRTEVVQVLTQLGIGDRQLQRPRKELYSMLCERMPLKELGALIGPVMAQREAWRDRPRHASCGG